MSVNKQGTADTVGENLTQAVPETFQLSGDELAAFCLCYNELLRLDRGIRLRILGYLFRMTVLEAPPDSPPVRMR